MLRLNSNETRDEPGVVKYVCVVMHRTHKPSNYFARK